MKKRILLKLNLEQVNTLKALCEYGGDYEKIYKKLDYNTYKNIFININDMDSLSYKLDPSDKIELQILKKFTNMETGQYKL